MKAVILCGDMSIRLRPLTDNTPKCLLRVFDRCILDILIEKLIDAGADEIYISSGIFIDEITEFCEKQHYSADIIYCEEKKSYGNAGSIKNALKNTDEKFIVLRGDIYFDFSINNILRYHDKSYSDLTVCCIDDETWYAENYLYVDSDCSVSKIDSQNEKLTDEKKYLNTEIYIFSPGILDMIPENSFFDIEKDLLPDIFADNLRFISYTAHGNFFNINSVENYKKLIFFLFNNPLSYFYEDERFIFEDEITESGAEISAPCFIGNECKIESGALIGPYSAIGEKCNIGHDVSVSESVIGSYCRLSESSDITGSVLSENVKISENCSVENGCAIGYGCVISRFCRITENTKIWPGKRIQPQSSVSGNIYCETPLRIEFNSLGISGKVNFQFTPSDALKTGQAIASIPYINKIGIGCDGKEISDVYKDICSSGMRACGICCYDFGKIYKSQTYFFSAYCCLDAFIFISMTDDIISFSFSGKNGLPVQIETERIINNNYHFSAFAYCGKNKYYEKFNMQLFDSIYLYYLKKCSGIKKCSRIISVETDNILIKKITDEVFLNKTSSSKLPDVQILVGQEGKDFYVIEGDKSFSFADILIFVCEMKLAAGNDIIIKEDAPLIINEKAEYYGRKVYRIYDYKKTSFYVSNIDILKNIWAFDPIFLIAELINIVSESEMSINEIFEDRNKTEIRSTVMEYNCSFRELLEIIKNSGAKKAEDDIYYIYKNQLGTAKIRDLGNTRRLKIIIETGNIEASKELAAEVCGKLKDAYIDKDS